MPATLSREDVLRIAALARLELTAAEVELFTRQLAHILEYVEQIRALDTAGVAPTSHVTAAAVEREDTPTASLPRAEALARAPEAAVESGFFKVPRVLG